MRGVQVLNLGFQGCYAEQLRCWYPTFRRNMTPSCSGVKDFYYSA